MIFFYLNLRSNIYFWGSRLNYHAYCSNFLSFLFIFFLILILFIYFDRLVWFLYDLISYEYTMYFFDYNDVYCFNYNNKIITLTSYNNSMIMKTNQLITSSNNMKILIYKWIMKCIHTLSMYYKKYTHRIYHKHRKHPNINCT